MATYTPNLNLKKPAGTEDINVSDINGNMDKIDDKFPVGQLSTLADVITYFNTYKVGTVKVSNAVTQILAGANRQGMLTGYWISSEYIGYSLVDSAGDLYSGYITTTNSTATYYSLTRVTSTNIPASNIVGLQDPQNGDIQIIHVAGRLYLVRFFMNRPFKSSIVGSGWKTIFTFPSGFTPAYDLKFEVHDDINDKMIDGRVWNNTNSFDVYGPQTGGSVWGSFFYIV